MSRQYSDPNREAVGLPPAGQGAADAPAEPAAKSLDEMTKDELLAEAQARGVEADASMTKAEIREAIGA